VALVWSTLSRQARIRRLHAKYGPEIANRIVNKQVWQGETAEQLLESLGRPVDVDERVLKTKTKHVWKYYQKGANRFGLRIMLEDGVVVGWDEKL
jgi:hypothetical protein